MIVIPAKLVRRLSGGAGIQNHQRIWIPHHVRNDSPSNHERQSSRLQKSNIHFAFYDENGTLLYACKKNRKQQPRPLNNLPKLLATATICKQNLTSEQENNYGQAIE